jgi:thiamine biosynthesis lipoprotein
MSASRAEPAVVVEQSRALMGTRMSIHVAVPPPEAAAAGAAVEGALEWLAALSDQLTRFADASELAALNRAAGEWCPVSGTLFSVVAESVAAARATEGLFDPGLLPLLEALGYDRDYDEIEHRETSPSLAAADALAPSGRWRAIQLDAERLRIVLPEGLRLDLGGIAKGWAADAVRARHLARYDNVLIDAGGDMRAYGGPRPGEAWAVGIGNPLARGAGTPEAHIAVVTLRHGGIATSGATGRWWLRGGERQHHLLDPRTGRPVPLWLDTTDDKPDCPPLLATATALAPTAAQAEVAAKVALLRGYPEALRQVERAWEAARDEEAAPYGDARVALLLVLGDGTVACSGNIRDYLWRIGGGGNLWLD